MADIERPDFRGRPRRRPSGWTRVDPSPKRRRIDRQLLTTIALIILAGAAWLVPALYERSGPVVAWPHIASRGFWANGIQVVDGDTVRSGGKIYRLVGFNTPESGRLARCERERVLASKATHRLQELVDRSDVALARVACACSPGTEGTDDCNYGRLCGTLRADGRDVGSVLIAEGLAERYTCGATSCPPRKDWCAG
jgi:hypothetical protein